MKKFLLLLLLLLSSCRTQTVVLPERHHRDSLVTRVNTRVDSIYEGHFRQEKQRGDTILIHDSIYIERWRVNARVDTVTIIKTDTVSVAIPCPSWGKGADRRERGLAMKWWGRGFCLGGIGAVVLLLLLRIAMRLYLRR